MKRSLPFAALCAAVLIAAPALADNDFPPAISVTGEASISVPPDRAEIDAGVTSDARTAREASEANNAAMGKVIAALKNSGIDEKDVQTSRISLQPRYGPNRDMPAPIGYVCALTDPDGNVIEISHNQGVYDKVDEVWGGGD